MDFADGVLTDNDLRDKTREVADRAVGSTVEDEARWMLSELTTGTEEDFDRAVRAMSTACDPYCGSHGQAVREAQRMVDVQERLFQVSELTTDAWLDALRLAEGRALFDAIRGHLADFHNYGEAGRLVLSWYRGWALAGCRRLLDSKDEASGMVRALKLLQPVAPELTAETVLERWRIAGTAGQSTEAVAAQALEAVSDGRGRVTSRDVHKQVRELQRTHGAIVDLTSQTVAHRYRKVEASSVQLDDLAALEDDILTAVTRWHRVVNGSHLSLHRKESFQGDPLELALRLFDRGAYVDAVQDARRRARPASASWTDEPVVRVRYEVEL